MYRIALFALAVCFSLALFAPGSARAYDVIDNTQCMSYANKYPFLPAEDFCGAYRLAQDFTDFAIKCSTVRSSLSEEIDKAFDEAWKLCTGDKAARQACEEQARKRRRSAQEANAYGFNQCMKRKFFQ